MKETPEDYDLILPFEKEILRLSGVMSKQGHSETSASIAIPALCNTTRKLLLFESVVPINLKKEDEWYEYESGKFQHKRCSELFRDG
jgi:hypothetical protein